MRQLGAAAFAATMTGLALLAADGDVLQTFRVEERFGVAHPTQVIDFDLVGKVESGRVHVVDAAGKSVLSQVIDGGKKIAIQTDLPAGQAREWRLKRGVAPGQFASAIKVTDYREKGRSGIQISNGMTGVRLPPVVTASALQYRPPVDLFNYGADVPRLFLPAPVQGIQFCDGKWGGIGPNGLVVLGHRLGRMTVRFVERGPLKVVVEVAYLVDHPEYRYGSMRLKPAGRGSYRATITVLAGQPSILFEEDTDLEMTWSANLYPGLRPTQARYRGHHATTRDFGYGPDGQTYQRGDRSLDAQVDLKYERPMPAAFSTTADTRRWLAVWDPWVFDSGWYWQMYDDRAPDSAPLVGVFAGRASAALGAAGSGVGLFTLPAPGPKGEPLAGVTVGSYRRTSDNRVFPRTRFQWGLFVGTKGQDLKKPDEVQPINRQMNLHAGINLNKLHRLAPDFPDPPSGYGGLYMDRSAVAAIKDRVRANDDGYRDRLAQADPTSRPLLDLWANRSGDKLRAVVADITKTAHGLLDALVNGEGIYSFPWHYWHGGLAMMRHGVWIDQALADPALPDADRRAVKAAAALFGSVLWDNDFVPLDVETGLNLGTANMPVQQTAYRHFYALLLGRHPAFASHAAKVEEAVRGTVPRLVNEHGAEIGCPHYIAASFAPTVQTLMQLKQLGREDAFRAEPRLARFAEFYLNLLTPPEPRVGDNRALVSLGDGSTEPSELYGVLGTAFRDADPKLSARLMGAWRACGRPHSGFFGSTLLMIDDRLPAAEPALGDADTPGYCAVLRHGWGTPNETALWLASGDHYSDHRHHDHGAVVLYALGKPLSIDWGSLYTPRVPAAFQHSAVVLERMLDHPWDQDSPPIAGNVGWGPALPSMVTTFPEGAVARVGFRQGSSAWTRTAVMVRADPANPVIILRDAFIGADAAAPKVLSLNLMATGPVETPTGPVAPTPRRHLAKEYKGEVGDELPSATPAQALPAGVSRFSFTGRYDVDWEVYMVGDRPRQALLGNWAVTPWGGFITDKEERQHILRVRGDRGFTTVIVPWRRGQKPAGLTVHAEGAAVVMETAATSTRVEANGYSYRGPSGSASRRWEE